MQAHINHHCDDRWWVAIGDGLKVSEPLHDDECVHKAEQGKKHDYLRDELQDEVHLIIEIDSVEGPHANSKSHLRDPQDDRKLHLQRVQVGQLQGG